MSGVTCIHDTCGHSTGLQTKTIIGPGWKLPYDDDRVCAQDEPITKVARSLSLPSANAKRAVLVIGWAKSYTIPPLRQLQCMHIRTLHFGASLSTLCPLLLVGPPHALMAISAHASARVRRVSACDESIRVESCCIKSPLPASPPAYLPITLSPLPLP